MVIQLSVLISRAASGAFNVHFGSGQGALLTVDSLAYTSNNNTRTRSTKGRITFQGSSCSNQTSKSTRPISLLICIPLHTQYTTTQNAVHPISHTHQEIYQRDVKQCPTSNTAPTQARECRCCRTSTTVKPSASPPEQIESKSQVKVNSDILPNPNTPPS